MIESHISDRFLSESESPRDESFTLVLSQELFKVKQEISSLTKTLKTEEDQQPISSFAADAVSSRTDSGGKNKMFGFDDGLEQIINWLYRGTSSCLSIVGMAGIGKTTRAKKMYNYPFASLHFHTRFFLTIGPEYKLKELLLIALDQAGVHINKMHEEKDDQLGTYLYQSLFGTRYLIVLDDVWSTQVWNELIKFFPDNSNGRRIILTTRLVDIAGHASSYANILQIRFLNDDESWNLLHKMVFTTKESCHPQLEKIGRKIAKNCEGLPLAIVEVGNLLRKTETTIENWKKVAENENALIIKTVDDTPISKAISLSYKKLPQHLKACFLYMGVFPKDYEIPTSKLIKLWVAEGFIEPRMSKSLEEMAEECLNDLVSRSLVLVREWSSRVELKPVESILSFGIYVLVKLRMKSFSIS